MGKSWNERRAWTCGTPVSWRILFATCTSAQNEKHMLTCVSQHYATMTTVDQAASCDEHIKWTTFRTVHNNTAFVTHSVGGHTIIHITLHACCFVTTLTTRNCFCASCNKTTALTDGLYIYLILNSITTPVNNTIAVTKNPIVAVL